MKNHSKVWEWPVVGPWLFRISPQFTPKDYAGCWSCALLPQIGISRIAIPQRKTYTLSFCWLVAEVMLSAIKEAK